MTTELNDLNIVVTGGTGALGSDIVSALVARGATCYIPSFFDPPTESPERVHYRGPIDLSESEQVREYYEKLPTIWASVHVAGGFAMSGICDTSFEDFEKMWRMNTVSTFLCCQASVVNMRAAGTAGRILNVAAKPAVDPVGGMLAYTTSKAGVASLTQCLAKELAPEGITVNAILPAIMDTPANREAMPDADHANWPKTSEIAHVVASLVSPHNSLTSGCLVPVYGKMT
ncbi:MAG: SDR family NAD(P)-dependent oxidoreductase [Kofleriaceae bacterium]|nr:SDR family NAD(P)-dependent oxidoreductase [Kofleriaceae bacterium]